MKEINQTMHFDNYRQIKIVKMLMDEKEPIPCAQIAAHFRVSERLIREDIKALKYILGKYEVLLLSKRGIGYYLSTGTVDLERVIKESLGSLYYYDNVGVIDKFAREQLILRYLILNNRKVKPQEIMEEFFITRTTLKKDIERAKETIEHYPIKLISNPYQGIYLEGSELGKRMLLNRETAFYKDQSIFHMLHERIEVNGITLEDLLFFVRDTCKIDISNVDLFNLYSHLNILLLRISQQQYITSEELCYKDYVQDDFYKNVRSYLSTYQDLSELPESEIYYFCLLILSSGYQVYSEMKKERQYCFTLLHEMEQEIACKLYDEEIVEDIAKLWMTLEVKSVNSISSSPLLVRDIKKFKPLAVDLAYRFSNKMKEHHQIQLFDNDICALAYMFQKHMKFDKRALNILVVSARGALFTQGLLVEELKKLFPREKFIYCDLYDIEKKLRKSTDIIITDVSLTYHDLPCPAVKVDFFHVGKQAYEIDHLIQTLRKTMIDRLYHHAFALDVTSKEEVLNWYCKKFGDEALYQQLIIREEKLTYEVNKRIAVICIYGPSSLPTCLLKFPSFYWKNADISHAVVLNCRELKPELLALYEESFLHMDEYFLEK